MKRRDFLKGLCAVVPTALVAPQVLFEENAGLSLDYIRKAKECLRRNNIEPSSYYAIVHPETVWAQKVYGEAKKRCFFNNPLFKGEIGEWSGVVIHKMK